jgi:diguanylate cyclase (GGDEF)-like protein
VLRVLRFLGLLAPVALVARVALVPQLESVFGTGSSRELTLAANLLTALAGAGVACLLASLWIGARLNALGRAADRIAAGDYSVRLRVPSGGVERRLATAMNAVAETLSEKHSAATTDKLTGVANRSALLAALFTEIERVNRYDRPLSIAFIDLDHFKNVNDTYGHDAGDLVLQRVAAILRDNVRRQDTVGRYGGEEFMIILRETDVNEAARLAEKLRMLVEREEIKLDHGQVINVTVSIGIAGRGGGQVSLEPIVRDADGAMYGAKSLGRNRTYVFVEPDEDSLVARAPISAEGRASAEEIGRAAAAAAEQVLRSFLKADTDGEPSERIAGMATRVARHFKLPKAEVERIRVAGLLHDVGTAGVPQEILEKSGPLTADEWQRIAQHPRIGQVILEQASSLRQAMPIILHHHERFGGQGYPHGLQGNDIPLGARILAVADAYDAMTHDRPYKPKLDHATALDELRRNAGTQFDPDVVEAFCAMFAEGITAEEPEAEAEAEHEAEPRAANGRRMDRSDAEHEEAHAAAS